MVQWEQLQLLLMAQWACQDAELLPMALWAAGGAQVWSELGRGWGYHREHGR